MCRGRCGGSSFRWAITDIIAVIVIVIVTAATAAAIGNDIVARMALRREVGGVLVGLIVELNNYDPNI